MEVHKTKSDLSQETPSLPFKDPLIIGAGALVLGFAIGSGRLPFLGRSLLKVMESLGSFALVQFSQSFQKSNPELFSMKKEMTH